jgi:hypothetical protein
MKRFSETVLLLASLASSSQAATWYVATNGNDSSACSAAAPCLSVNAAYQKASGGDAIILAGGSYGAQTMNSKTPASDIIVQPASGASVNLGSLAINGATHLEFRNMATNEFTVHMNSNFVTLRNVAVNGWLGYDGGSNITMIGGSVGPVVDGHPQIAPGNGWLGQGVNFVFDGVLFHDVTRTNANVHTECLQVAGTTGMVIRNSKFQHCDVFDLSFTEYNGSGKVTNLLLENNVFEAATDGGFFTVNLSQFSGGKAWYNSSNQGWVVQGTNTAPMTITANDIVGSVLSGTTGGCSSDAKYAYNIFQGQTCASTDANAAPGFVNVSGHDFSLSAGTKAIDFVPLAVGGPATDINGNARPAGAQYDAGAVEFGAGAGGGIVQPPPTVNPPTQLQLTVH